jgi:hypothetical protein
MSCKIRHILTWCAHKGYEAANYQLRQHTQVSHLPTTHRVTESLSRFRPQEKEVCEEGRNEKDGDLSPFFSG